MEKLRFNHFWELKGQLKYYQPGWGSSSSTLRVMCLPLIICCRLILSFESTVMRGMENQALQMKRSLKRKMKRKI